MIAQFAAHTNDDNNIIKGAKFMKRKKMRKQPEKNEQKSERVGLPENLRVVHSGEPNPHDG